MGTQIKLCLWHALQQINKHILARPAAKNSKNGTPSTTPQDTPTLNTSIPIKDLE